MCLPQKTQILIIEFPVMAQHCQILNNSTILHEDRSLMRELLSIDTHKNMKTRQPGVYNLLGLRDRFKTEREGTGPLSVLCRVIRCWLASTRFVKKGPKFCKFFVPNFRPQFVTAGHRPEDLPTEITGLAQTGCLGRSPGKAGQSATEASANLP